MGARWTGSRTCEAPASRWRTRTPARPAAAARASTEAFGLEKAHGLSSAARNLRRGCDAIQIPSGTRARLPEGTPISLAQSLGGSFTVEAAGGLYRIDGADADALGLEPPAGASRASRKTDGPVSEDSLWDELRECYDPEIPVNIVDLGLVYDLSKQDLPRGGTRVSVKMTLTATGCGMGTAIAADARHRLESLPGVVEADVQLVWDPPWSATMMTEAGRKRLGIA